MTEPVKHHFFAQFHLKAWADEKDGRIPTFLRVADNSIRKVRFLPSETGFEKYLNSLEGVPTEQRQRIEKEFFARRVDEKAALVYQKLIVPGRDVNLTADERAHWTRYLIAQRARVPNVVKNIKEKVRAGATELLEGFQQEYLTARGELSYETAQEWFDKTQPGRLNNIALQILLRVIQNPEVAQDISAMNWWVQDLKDSYVPLLASDRPLGISMGIGKPDCVISLPLTPSKLFMASPKDAMRLAFARQPPIATAQDHNKVVVKNADRWVYGSSDLLFVERHWNPRTKGEPSLLPR